MLVLSAHGFASPLAAAEHETGAYIFPAGHIRVTNRAASYSGWRLISVYRGRKLVRDYQAQPLSDGSWAVHRATVYC